MNKEKIMYWVPRVVGAFLLLQTVPGKLMGNEMVAGMFEKLDILGTGGKMALIVGLLELLAGVFLLVPKLSKTGATVGAVIMAGAIFFHITTLGTGQMMYMAIIALLACLAVLFVPGCKGCCSSGSCSIKK